MGGVISTNFNIHQSCHTWGWLAFI